MTGKYLENSLTIAVNDFYAKNEKIYPPQVSKQISEGGEQVIILMILNGEGQRYLVVKKLSALSRGITSQNDDDFYSLKCFHSFKTKKDIDSHRKVCESM